MNVLVLNAGSSSLKFGVYRVAGEPEAVLTGTVEGFGAPASRIEARDAAGKILQARDAAVADLGEAARQVIALVRDGTHSEPDAIGHRIVHGGADLRQHCVIGETVLKSLEEGASFAPLHGPPALSVVRIAREAFPHLPHVACLDTVFHETLPDIARRFPLPPEFAASGLYRYGFHGLVCESVVHRLRFDLPERLIVAHLGSGASITAIRRGHSVDTSMGLTPTGGIMMATRSGDLDPGLLIWLARNGYDADKLEQLLDRQSGLAGVSGLGGDMRALHAAQAEHDNARLAIAMFCHSARKAIAGMAAALEGIDLLVFTGGIGEHDARVRDEILRGLSWLPPFEDRIMEAEEDVMIARHTARIAAS